MFEKNLNVGYLLDFYGDILPERRRSVMAMYYFEDLSLAEIASEIGISRQGVRDIIKKTEEELFFYEQKLGLAKKLRTTNSGIEALRKQAASLSLPDEFMAQIDELKKIISQ